MLNTMKVNLVVTQHSSLDKRSAEEMRSIYLESFPSSERVDFPEIISSLAKAERGLFTARLLDKVIGFAIIMPLQDTNVYLLEYLAVSSESRNQGIGVLLLRAVSDILRSRGGMSGIIIEVESDDNGEELENQIRKRRIQFYSRNGAHLVECAPYYYGPRLDGEPGAIKMKLMWLPLTDKVNFLSGVKLRDCIRAIYIQSYGRLTNDPLLQQTLSKLLC